MDGYLLSLQLFRFCLSGTGLFCDLFTSEHPSPMYRGENPQGALWRSSLQTRTVARVGSPNANVSMATPRPVRRIADDPGAPNVAGYDALQISPKTGQPHGGDPSAQGRFVSQHYVYGQPLSPLHTGSVVVRAHSRCQPRVVPIPFGSVQHDCTRQTLDQNRWIQVASYDPTRPEK
jgi:hypothetical protein